MVVCACTCVTGEVRSKQANPTISRGPADLKRGVRLVENVHLVVGIRRTPQKLEARSAAGKIVYRRAPARVVSARRQHVIRTRLINYGRIVEIRRQRTVRN